jgi:hypothetical protein
VTGILFCNIGWMSRYEGLAGKPDKIVGGGKWVREHGTGAEICNFTVGNDGYVYGHVETIHGETDRKIRLESVGGSGESVSGIDVIWTATDPEEGGRKVVGWYRNATVFRERQHFDRPPPSRQHARDKLTSYRIRARAEDVRRLELEERTLSMGRGQGWMGHTPWWAPSERSPAAVRRFVDEVRTLFAGGTGAVLAERPGNRRRVHSPSAPSDPYVRYVEAYEIRVTPHHDALQRRFERFLCDRGATDMRPNVAGVDVRFRDRERGAVLAEIKPCEPQNVRYAIRMAMGQLLDYRQRAGEDVALLIVLGRKPREEDRLLALTNGFGIAYQAGNRFSVSWPEHDRNARREAGTRVGATCGAGTDST